MDITCETHPPKCRVTVAGELDLATSARLRTALADVIDAGHIVVELDLDGVTFIDSSGLHVLTWAHAQTRRIGGRLTLDRPSRSVTRLLRITQTEALLS